jgi:hypothetical protein
MKRVSIMPEMLILTWLRVMYLLLAVLYLVAENGSSKVEPFSPFARNYQTVVA